MNLLRRLRSKQQLRPTESPRQSDRSITFDSDDAILAFRTITTMLSLIQSPTETTSTREKEDFTKDKRRELKILDALSAVAVRRFEIVAVVAKSYNRSNLEVIASVNNAGPALNIHQQDSGSLAALKTSFQWFITPNPRNADRKSNRKIKEDSLTTRKQHMTLVEPHTQISEKLSKANSDNLLDVFLENEWGEESFDTHIWMLMTLLGRSKDDLKTLQLYIIAASFPKMIHRMRGQHLSERYFDCLRGLKSKTFVFIDSEPSHIATAPNVEDPDQTLLDFLPGLTSVTNIDNLLEAKAKGIEIYNKETYMEFHNLLCELLLNFRDSLIKLELIKNEKKGDVGEIRDQLRIVLSLGRSLRAVVTGAAIEKHLKAVAHLLEVDNGNSWVTVDEEGDAEFDALQPYSSYRGKPLLPWQSYKNWLRLMVVYFDAASILGHYLSGFSSEISVHIKILAPCLSSKGFKMLPWEKLLRHETYFPELPNVAEQPSAEELISFLTSDYMDMDSEGNKTKEETTEGERSNLQGVSIQEIIKSVRELKKEQESAIAAKGVDMDNLTDAFNLVSQRLSQLKDCSSIGSAECISTIFKHLQSLILPDQTPEARFVLIRDIVEMLETLKARSSLYWALKKDTPLTLGDRFSGTRHCEMCIAIFNWLSGFLRQDLLRQNSELMQYDAILNEFKDCGQAIGVSKRCCPVCVRLLDLLKTHDGKPFFTSGGHSTITPCTLPEWLPADIIKTMVVEFGTRLRRDLVKLRQRTEVLRRRTSSIDTQRLSMDSTMPRKETVDYDELNANIVRHKKQAAVI